MQFWFDLSTPKEVLFFLPLIRELQKRRHSIILTTRKYTETNDLIKYFGLDAYVIGKHGETKTEKLREGIKRLNGLYRLFEDKDIDGVITLANPEVCRIAFGLDFPIFNFIDLTEATVVCKLGLPLSNVVFIPFHVDKKKISKYWNGKTYRYNCIDPIAWMPKFPNPETELGIEKQYLNDEGKLKHPFVVYRKAETKATYHSEYKDFTASVICMLKNKLPKATFYEIPRYEKHKILDLQSLLYYADLFIGGGGTITEEACYWGTWTVSCRSFFSSYDKWLEQIGSLVHAKSAKEGVNIALQLLKKNGKNPSCKILKKQRFPLERICNIIEKECSRRY